jgi:hypothetical protein
VKARKLIKDGKLDEAMGVATKLIHTATKIRRRIHAQIWFDRDCYRERKETLQAKTYKQLSDLTHYAEKRRNYKILLKEKRADYIEKEAKKVAEEAKADPFLALKKRTPQTTGEI